MYLFLAWFFWILSLLVYAKTYSAFLGSVLFMLGLGALIAHQKGR